ncbi:site-specific integrase [Rufibacter sp. XAAS-G3-1]|uniref:tyrosine-type recombinase/integrase n=1 Tax=Rufibacter sp. XAAS-G3-1 TaxID=2729134 RepID=UPI0015E66DFB|nr:site-specific integrase [Rufibacter sp. XAAS-G3-1]
MNATATIVLDTRREKADGRFPIKIRITYNRRSKYYSAIVDNELVALSPDEWEKVVGPKPRSPYKEIGQALKALEHKAGGVIKEIPLFSFAEFEKRFKSNRNKNDVYSSFEDYIKSLQEEGRITTALSYGNALSSLSKFRKPLLFDDVTPEFLHKYEKWMLGNNKSLTTIGFYLRSLRTIINEAKEAGIVKPEQYPFGTRRYTIPKGRNVKKALNLSQIEKIYYHPVEEGTMEEKARDLWFFSYLCNGMNIKDICLLKGKNISNGKISFYRAKTKRTTRIDPKPIEFILPAEAQQIIDKWGNKYIGSESYVYPFLNDCETPTRERQIINQLTKNINTYMKRIATELELDINLTTYVARHSFSTVLKRSGASKEYIQESLGHQDSKTTEHYLDSFEDDIKKQFSDSLLAFKK